MVGRAYLLAKRRPPTALKRAIDQRMIPAAIDAAGALEAVLERISVSATRQPITALGAAFGLGLLGCLLAAGCFARTTMAHHRR